MGHTLALNSDGTPLGLVPLSVLNWQDAVKALYLGTVSVVHEYENWTVKSPSRSFAVPSVVMARQYVKNRRTVRYSKEFVYLRDLNTCQYCGGEFPNHMLTLDHVVPKSHGGKLHWTNATTACGPCNSRRGNNTRIQPKVMPYRPTYSELANKRRKYPITIPHESWLPYLQWPEHLVTIVPPIHEAGFLPDSVPENLLRSILLDDEGKSE